MTDDDARLDGTQLRTYLDLVEVVALLRRSVERQLREDGGLSYVQFQILTTLGAAPEGRRRMTDLADGIVASRSGLTYQVGLLVASGLLTRSAATDDERGVEVTLTAAGRDLLADLLPRHVAVVRSLLFAPLTGDEVAALGDLLQPVRDHMRAVTPGAAARDRTVPR